MPGHVTIRCHEELNDFLPPARRDAWFDIAFQNPGSVKDLVESVGIPHTEIDLITVNDRSVGFDHLYGDGDRIHVYPHRASAGVASFTPLRPDRRDIERFVLDTHLGRLAAYLRMLGFDTLYRNDFDDATLLRLSVDDDRTLLTRDRKLLMRKQLHRAYFVRSTRPRDQLLETSSRFGLAGAQQPFTRCMHCNGPVAPVSKAAISGRLLPRTSKYYEDFWQCRDCGKIYWQGSHYRRMRDLIACTKTHPGD